MRSGLILLFCCFISVVAGAQSVENTLPRPVEELPRYGFDHFTVQDGLPESFVTSLMQDPQGYLWGATQNGLFRYDGQTLKTYVPRDGDQSMRSVRAIITDDRGDLWAGGVFGSGLARLDRASETWTIYQHDPDDPNTLSLENVISLADAGEGRLLIVSITMDGSRLCLDRLDTTTGQVRRFRLAPDGSIGPEGECIRPSFISLNLSQHILFARQESTGETWIATRMGLLTYDPVEDTITHHRSPLLNPYSDFPALETLASNRMPLAAIQEVGGQEDRTVSFEVTEDTPVLMVGLGEMRMKERLDYGWLENAQGDTLWSMQPARSSWGGGALRNRLVVSPDTLFPGSYQLRFRSDQGHSFGETFEREPAHPPWWGLQVLPLEAGDVVPSATGPVLQTEDDAPADILAIHADAWGDLWIATSGDGVYRRDAQTGRFTPFKPQGEDFGLKQATFLMIKTDRKGRTWFGSSTGIYRIDDFEQGVLRYIRIPAEETALSLPLPTVAAQRNVVVGMVEDQDGTLWIHTFAALVHLDPETEAMQIYEPDPEDPDGLGVGLMTALFQDRQETLWAGTRNRGLSRLNRTKSQFNAFATDLLQSNDVESIIEGPGGDLWIGTDEGLSRLTTPDGSATQPAPILTDQASQVYVDRSGRLWGSGTQSGLHLLDATGKVLKTYTHDPTDSLSISDNNVSVVLEDSQGRLWVGTSRAGINRFDPEAGTFTRYPFHRTPRPGVSDSLDDRTVFVIFEDKGERLWTGTNLGGISRFDPEAGTFTSHFNDGLGLVAIVDIYEDAAGHLWAGSYIGGLFRIDPATGEVVAQYDESSGLLHNFVGQIQGDEAGYLWLGTGRGIVRFDPKTETFRTFHRLEGMSQRTFTATSFKTREGGLLFGGGQGLIAFDPVALAAMPMPPDLALEMMTHKSRGGDVQVPLGTQRFVELAHNENDVTLGFVAIDFERPDAIRYRYRLTPYDEAWIDGGTQQRARYTSLSPGWYTFEVQAVNADGLWSEPKTLRVGINPPWWKTWWAYMLYSIPLFGFGLGTLWVARRRAVQQERERSHRELEAAYTQLDASHKELQTTQEQLVQQEKMASLGQLTAGIAHEIKNPLNFVNNFADLNTELAEELREALAKDQDIEPILKDLEENASQIAKHGRRADGIVRSMMQHASTGSSDKEATDINAFVGEYVDLAHHGKRAQAPDFDLRIERDFDEETGTAEIIPQEMGRVFLNLFGNAFDAVFERGGRSEETRAPRIGVRDRLRATEASKGETEYVPTVTVTTRRLNDYIEIRMTDNGPGIPEQVRKKIFEPFFTTKPTGTGTGLGLSLSYDIVTKGHGGTLQVESEEGEGATFIVTLPV